ncbi:MAG: substrate-binding domain-containing protein [Firmicutes bacterium]|nr:substrate-binding domain-containing protein [Bacillota bacterium]
MEYFLESGPRFKQRFTIGFIDEDAHHEYPNYMTTGIFEAARKYGMNVIRFGHFGALSKINKNDSCVQAALDHIQQYNLDGILLLGWASEVHYFGPDYFRKRFHSTPLISLGSSNEGIPSIYFPGAIYIEEILVHLIQVHGLKKIAFIAPITPDPRSETYRDTMKKYGIYDPNLYVPETELENLDLDERGRMAVAVLLDRRKAALEAVVSLYNHETKAIIDELQSRGYQVPGDIAVTSYEDGKIGRFSTPSFTTVYFPWREIGFYGCEKMYELLTQGHIPLSMAVPGRVIFRDSCGCISQAVNCAKTGFIRPAIQSLREIPGPGGLQAIWEECRQEINSRLLDWPLLIKSFEEDYQRRSNDQFLFHLELQLREITDPFLFPDIEDIISVLRRLMLPYFMGEPQTLFWAENLFLQAQVLVQEKKEAVWANQEVQTKNVHLIVQEIGQILVTHFNLPDILDSLASNLHRLNIPGCYIFFFRNKNYCENIFHEYGLAFKYYKGNCKKFDIGDSDTAKQRLSQIIFPEKRPFTMVARLLHVADEFIGFVVFDCGPMDISVYRLLSLNLSTALSDAFLLEKLNLSYQKKVEQAHLEGMMAIINGILHNIGNVLNSISVSTQLIRDLIYNSPLDDLLRANQLLENNLENLTGFLGCDPKGKKLMQFYTKLGGPFQELHDRLLEQINRLNEKIKLINDIILTQEGYIGIKSTLEEIDAAPLIEDVLKIYSSSLGKYHIQIVKNYQKIPKIKAHKTKLFYVLVNLIKNAKDALLEVPESRRRLLLSIEESNSYKYIRVTDTGPGIPPELLQSIFAYGYTTKKGGHGFGLHSCANYMTEMEGKIWAESPGPGEGATFVLQFR